MTMDLSLQKPNEPVREITNNLGSDQVRLKPGYTVIEDGQRLEILDLESRGIVLSVVYYPCSEDKGADQLRSYCEADLRLCFRLCRLLVFPCGGSNFDSLPSKLKLLSANETGSQFSSTLCTITNVQTNTSNPQLPRGKQAIPCCKKGKRLALLKPFSKLLAD